jgi:hypothetical protein
MHPFDDILIDLAKAAPGLVALVIVVFFFLRDRKQATTALGSTLTEISGRCHDVQDKANDIQFKTIEQLGKNAAIANQVLHALERMEKRLNGVR